MRKRPAAGPVRHPIFARCYDKLSRGAEQQGAGDHRQEALAGLSGRVVEVGAGNGLNFAYYPATVTEVVAVEPEPHLRGLAERAAAAANVAVRVVDGTAERLPLDSAAFDAGVASLVLCSVADQRQALGELSRVLRPGGQLRFYEHVRSTDARQARMQRAADVVWPRLAGGCHTSHDTVAAIRAAGFQIEAVRGFRFPDTRIFIPASPHAIGRAVKHG
ncbi:MAG: methyltransferase domain-containing protein [Actinomycetota bacterium]|jgi:ubiquinone/menaquinone biosynthesis C-methylase UbiE|nr:methyltransferase domain-containing protein [Actinomycetota bacterium]